MNQLAIESMGPAGEELRLALVGEADMESVGTLHDALQGALATPALARLLLDLKDTTFLDSEDIHALVVACRKAEELGITFRIVNTSAISRLVLAITGVLEFLTGES